MNFREFCTQYDVTDTEALLLLAHLIALRILPLLKQR